MDLRIFQLKQLGREQLIETVRTIAVRDFVTRSQTNTEEPTALMVNKKSRGPIKDSSSLIKFEEWPLQILKGPEQVDGINEKLSVKSKSINQYVKCTEKRLKYENRAKQMHEESPKGQQKNCNSYTGLNQRGNLDYIIPLLLKMHDLE
ncbi:hypothetical protein Smp_128030 [Schistosoma mansoni]|uniref:hypothetical protein n=1 Tax=Schistosoma mansoni TaxID=6183 RepID=UPI0001A63FBF|nr:hypothetical protein Smp_128030 [Schistosoma mansoni]|eukprot:XP_018646278.1 hypothetical protein Smp_128030 [Schistosoma mansoni]